MRRKESINLVEYNADGKVTWPRVSMQETSTKPRLTVSDEPDPVRTELLVKA
jgi:hypothetical protein